MASARLPADDPLQHAEALMAQGRHGEAADMLGARIAEGRGGILARLMWARALRRSGDVDGAMAAARETAQLQPALPAAIIGLGEALLAREALPSAIGEFQRALRLDPGAEEAVFGLGEAWLCAGEPDKALAEFAKLDHSPRVAGKRAEAEAMRAAERANPAYVRHLFDQFSVDYDARMLGQLGYRAPAILRGLFDLVMSGRDGLSLLDLGCGTGLGAAAFAGVARVIDGVDLSPRMLEKARARGLYRALAAADIETYLEAASQTYDLILAADTLVYLGDLTRTLAGAARCLAPRGMMLFTVERGEAAGFELGPKRRWRHSADYLRAAAAAAGLGVAGLVEASPRSEAGDPVGGYAVALEPAAFRARLQPEAEMR